MSERVLTFDDVVSLLQALALSAEMIAIDGAPLAGKSTLAERLVAEFGFGLMSIDDFVRAEEDTGSCGCGHHRSGATQACPGSRGFEIRVTVNKHVDRCGV